MSRPETDEARLAAAEHRLASGDLDPDAARRTYQELLGLYRARWQDSRRLLEATLASLADGVAIFDAAGRLRIANPVVATLLEAPSVLTREAWRYDDLAAALIDAGASVTVGLDRGTSGHLSDEVRFPGGRVVEIRRSRMPDGGEIHVYVDVTQDQRRAVDSSAARASSAVAADERPLQPLSILFAEDDSISQMIGVGLLERLGHHVVPVDDGRPAVDAVASGLHFDVILIDLFMPTMDGIAATRAIRSLPGARHDVPIVGVSASAVRADVDAAMAAGMCAVIAKPFDEARLSAVLAQATAEPQGGDGAAPLDCDAVVMRQLHGALGRDAVTAAMRRFLDAMASNQAELAAMLASNPAQAVSFAHRLAGSAAVFGLGRLSQALLGIEQALRAGEIDRASAQLAPLPELVSTAIQRLAAAA